MRIRNLIFALPIVALIVLPGCAGLDWFMAEPEDPDPRSPFQVLVDWGAGLLPSGFGGPVVVVAGAITWAYTRLRGKRRVS